MLVFFAKLLEASLFATGAETETASVREIRVSDVSEEENPFEKSVKQAEVLLKGVPVMRTEL